MSEQTLPVYSVYSSRSYKGPCSIWILFTDGKDNNRTPTPVSFRVGTLLVVFVPLSFPDFSVDPFDTLGNAPGKVQGKQRVEGTRRQGSHGRVGELWGRLKWLECARGEGGVPPSETPQNSFETLASNSDFVLVTSLFPSLLFFFWTGRILGFGTELVESGTPVHPVSVVLGTLRDSEPGSHSRL